MYLKHRIWNVGKHFCPPEHSGVTYTLSHSRVYLFSQSTCRCPSCGIVPTEKWQPLRFSRLEPRTAEMQLNMCGFVDKEDKSEAFLYHCCYNY